MIGRSRLLTGILLVAAAIVSALVVVIVAWERDGGDESSRVGGLPAAPTPTPPPGGTDGRSVGPSADFGELPIGGLATLTPRIVLFGDRIRAQIDVVFDSSRIDAESVRVASSFAPWEVVGDPERVRRDAGTTTYIRTTYALRCLTSPCVPSGQAAPLQFDDARISFLEVGGGGKRESMPVDLPVLTVYSRFASANFEGALSTTPWRADVLTMPAVSWRIAPGLALVLLVAGGALLTLGGLALVYVAWPRREPAPPPEPEPEPLPLLSPLEQALVLLEDAAREDGAEDRRRALEQVAEVLDEHGDFDEMARWARVLAWSEHEPAVEETSDLAARVRAAIVVEQLEDAIGAEAGRVV